MDTRAGATAALWLALACLVGLGMATGTHTQFEKGVVSGWVVALQLGLGALFFATALPLSRATAKAWRGVAWATGELAVTGVCCLLLWAFWAFVRVGQYAS